MTNRKGRSARYSSLRWLLYLAMAFIGWSGLVIGSFQDAAPQPSAPVETTNNTTTASLVLRLPIGGTIDLGLAPFVARVVEEAQEQDAIVLLDINTFGGRVDAAVLIRDALIDAPVRTIAFINPRAISAGALISLACETIVIAPGGSIGAATPITGGGTEGEVEAADEKFLSYMRTEMRTTAEKRGRRGDVAEAMVDRDVEIEGVVEKGKVLTLSSEEAMKLEISDYLATDLEEALEKLGLGEAEVEDREENWAELIARAITEPTVSSMLLSLGFLGIIIELYQPGWGIPGTLGAVALIIFFFGHNVVQLAGAEELMLFALGAGLLLLELLVIPGFGIAGFGGLALLFVAVLMSLLALDLRVSWDLGFVNRALITLSTSIVVTAVLGYLLIRLLPATGATRRIVLGEALSSEQGFTSHDPEEKMTFPLGTRGEAITDLRPAGKIRIDKKRIDAVTEGNYIASGSPVAIIAWSSGTAVVRAEKTEDDAA